MLEDDDMGAGETAIDYSDQFANAAVARLDALFGEGYARDHPEAFAAYMAASASNLRAFMTAAAAMQGDLIAEAMASLEQPEATFGLDLTPPSSPRRKGKGRR
jgi:hypothetical protein